MVFVVTHWLLSALILVVAGFVYVCADPCWASVNRGVFICNECAGIHRNLGRHVSQVKCFVVTSGFNVLVHIHNINDIVVIVGLIQPLELFCRIDEFSMYCCRTLYLHTTVRVLFNSLVALSNISLALNS